MSLPQFALRYKAIVLAITGLVTLAGMQAFLHAPRREDPEMKIRTCVVTTQWPGAPPEKVEQLLTDVIEDACNVLDDVKQVTSQSTSGVSVVFVDLLDATPADRVDQAWDEVRAAVANVQSRLPQGSSTPWVNTNFGDTAAMVLALYQTPPPGQAEITRWYTPRELEIVAENLQDELQLLDMVAQVELIGTQREAIYLEVDPGRWSKVDLTTSQLQQLLAQRNIVAPGGSVDTEFARFTVTPSGELNAVNEINTIVAGAANGRVPVLLEDLGMTVRRDYEDPRASYVRVGAADGAAHDCIVISFTMKSGKNISVLGAVVEKKIAEWTHTILPADVALEIVSDQPKSVNTTISGFVVNLVQSVLIVVGVAFLLIGWRTAIVMGTAIPVVMLAALGLMRLWNVELEQMSIASLIISLGMLVDCAVMVGDNVQRFLKMGKSPEAAAIEGSGQISTPALFGTLTTVAAFLPMLTFPGNKGEFIASLPIVVSITLLASWGLAMTLTTLMAYWMLKPDSGRPPIMWVLGPILALLRRGKAPSEGPSLFDRVSAATLKMKYVTVVVAFAAFVFSMWLVSSGRVGTQFFPQAFRAQFVVDIWLPPGTPIARTNAVVRETEALVREVTGDTLHNYVAYAGIGGPRFYLSLNPEQPNGYFGFLLVNTTDPHKVPEQVDRIRSEAAGRIAGARVVPKLLMMGPSIPYPITMRVLGPGLDGVQRYGDQVMNAFRATPGMLDVHDSWGTPSYQIDVRIDEDRAKAAAVTNAAVATSLNAMYTGHYLTTFREGDHAVPVYLRVEESQRSLTGVDALPVEGLHGKVPLEAVASVTPTWQPGRIERHKRRRNLEVRARVREGVLPNAALAAAWPEIERIRAAMAPGYTIEVGGEKEKTDESAAEMGSSFSISILLIVMCLIVQYNSFSKPVIILITLPLAAAGGIFGLAIMAMPLSFMAQLGMLSLAGVVLNSAIVLIDFIQENVAQRLKTGDGVAPAGARAYSGLTREAFRECVIAAARVRLMPISLTTLTTVGGLIPLLMFGGPMWEPLAAVIIFGLIIATVLTLLVVPALVAIYVETLRGKMIA